MADAFEELKKIYEMEDSGLIKEKEAPEPEKVEEAAELDAEVEEVAAADDVEADEDTEETEAEAEPETDAETDKKAKANIAYLERKNAEKLERLQQELAAERAARLAIEQLTRKPVQQAPARPNEQEDPDAAMAYDLRQAQAKLQEIEQERIKERALREVQAHVERFASTTPDVKDVLDIGYQRAIKAALILDPTASPADVEDKAKMDALRIASMAANRGNDPAESLYLYYKELTGYEPKAKEVAKPDKPSEAKKLEAVQRNKAKSGSPISGIGASGKMTLTKEALMNMTPAQYMRLTEEQRALYDQAM